MKKVVALLLGLMIGTASAQWASVMDTVTSGRSSDIDPQVDEVGLANYFEGFYGPSISGEWVVFERWSGNSDAVAAVRFSASKMEWDTAVAIISPEVPGVVKKFPDVCTSLNGEVIAAWQQEADSVWNIYYSVLDSGSTVWSAAVPLTNDKYGNTGVRVRALSDSSFVLIWKRGKAILSSVYESGGFSIPDTLVLSNTDSTDYDFANGQLAWTVKGDSGRIVCVTSTVTSFKYAALSPADTTRLDGDITNPRFMSFVRMSGKVFSFDLQMNGRSAAWWSEYPMVTGYTPEKLAGDSVSDYLNAVFYIPAYVVAAAFKLQKSEQLYPLNFYAWQKEAGSDTSVVFFAAGIDSVQQGKNPSITSLTLPMSPQSPLTKLGFVVWQSDRNGASHIYSRNFVWTNNYVSIPPGPPTAFILNQNYPNPFNPTTLVSYQLSSSGPVSLSVYDVLGRKVATLVDGIESAGEHSAVFDGSKFASGVYFYRLALSGRSIARKMMLVK